MLKFMKPGRKYIIINVDEPYAKIVFEILKYGQMEKDQWPEGDISFEEWTELTWSEDEFKKAAKEVFGAFSEALEKLS
jgi:hypothetical protein